MVFLNDEPSLFNCFPLLKLLLFISFNIPPIPYSLFPITNKAKTKERKGKQPPPSLALHPPPPPP